MLRFFSIQLRLACIDCQPLARAGLFCSQVFKTKQKGSLQLGPQKSQQEQNESFFWSKADRYQRSTYRRRVRCVSLEKVDFICILKSVCNEIRLKCIKTINVGSFLGKNRKCLRPRLTCICSTRWDTKRGGCCSRHYCGFAKRHFISHFGRFVVMYICLSMCSYHKRRAQPEKERSAQKRKRTHTPTSLKCENSVRACCKHPSQELLGWG